MFLFSRRSRLGPGNLMESMAWATKVTEKVNAVSDLQVSLWNTVFSPGLGTLSWTCVVEDLAQLESGEAKLLADPGYLSLVGEGATYSSGEAIDDGLIRLIHAAEVDPNAQPEYASVVQTVLAPGAAAAGIELGVDIAQRATAITGRPTSFGSALTGPYGAVAWFTVHDSVQQLQQSEDAIAADATFGKLIDEKASKVYMAGTGLQTIHRRIM